MGGPLPSVGPPRLTKGFQGVHRRFSSFSQRSLLLQSISKIYRRGTIRNQIPINDSGGLSKLNRVPDHPASSMKPWKKLLIGLLALLVMFIGIGFFLPAKHSGLVRYRVNPGVQTPDYSRDVPSGQHLCRCWSVSERH